MLTASSHSSGVAKVERNNAVALPVLSSYLRVLPPVWIATSGKDPLRDDGRMLESILINLQSNVKRVHYEGLPHYFHMFPGLSASHTLLRDVAGGIEFILDSQS
jgi:versiconal hemiacetal acetate esterase